MAGIGWASEVHVACLVDGDGTVTERFSLHPHDGVAIKAMVRRLRSAGVAWVAIERGDGPVVEELLGGGAGGVRGAEPADQGPADPVRVGG